MLQEIASHNTIYVTPLSRATSLQQATVTDTTKRLEAKGYITREKRIDNKRAVNLYGIINGTKDILIPFSEEFLGFFPELTYFV